MKDYVQWNDETRKYEEVPVSPEFEKWWRESWGKGRGANEEWFHVDDFYECWQAAIASREERQ